MPTTARVARTAVGLVLCSHPGPVLAVSGGVAALAWAAGRGPAGTAWSGLAVLAGQLSIGLSNDFLDRAADLAAGRRDKPAADGRVPARLVAIAAVVTLAFSAGFSLACGWRAGLAQLATVAAGWVYNLGLKRTVWSAVPFIPGFGLFPAFVTLGLPGHPWPAWWATTGGALLGLGAHFANVVPDLPADLATGVRGLPQRLGGRVSRIMAGMLLGAATAVLALAPSDAGEPAAPLRWAGAAVALLVAGTGVASAVVTRGGSPGRPAGGTAGSTAGGRPGPIASPAGRPGPAGGTAGALPPVARYAAMLAVIAAGLFDVVLLVSRGAHIA